MPFKIILILIILQRYCADQIDLTNFTIKNTSNKESVFNFISDFMSTRRAIMVLHFEGISIEEADNRILEYFGKRINFVLQSVKLSWYVCEENEFYFVFIL